MMRVAGSSDKRFIDRVGELALPEADRDAAVRQLDRAERAAEWSVRAMDRLDAFVHAMRGVTRRRDRRPG